MLIERACGRLGWEISGLRCVVQGSATSAGSLRPSSPRRARPSSRSPDVSGGVHARDGLDVPTLHEYVREHGSVQGFPGADRVSNDEVLELHCDVLVLAAREDQVNAHNAGSIQCRLLVEGANGPTSVEADSILAQRGSRCCPTC